MSGFFSRDGRRRALLALVAAGVLSAPVGWWVTDRLEADNDFCVSCHLAPDEPLHREKRAALDRLPAATLAAAHGSAGWEDRPFRCIDCHGGTGLVGKARVKLLSAKDAFWYAVGRFDEPDQMHWPLRDADCTRCHMTFDEREPESGRNPLFHELSVHNAELGVDCVACHTSHDEGGLADHYQLHPDRVRAECAACHPELGFD
jgi:hypothetical protein